MNAACTNKAAKFEELKRRISESNADAITVALESGFKVNSKDYLGRTLLMFAAEGGQTEIVKVLIAAGVKLDIRDQMHPDNDGGKTALHRAAGKRHAEVVNALIAAGAKLDVADKIKDTPLTEAVVSGDLKIVETLLKAGANPNGSEKGSTPLSVAVNSDSPTMVDLLLCHGADSNHPVDIRFMSVPCSAAIGDAVEICRQLINADADVNAKNEDGRTVLDSINRLIDNRLWMASQLERGIDKEQSMEDRRTIRAMLIEAGAKTSKELDG